MLRILQLPFEDNCLKTAVSTHKTLKTNAFEARKLEKQYTHQGLEQLIKKKLNIPKQTTDEQQHYLTSISHTWNSRYLFLAFALFDNQKPLQKASGIGIDIEHQSRKISKKVLKKVNSSKDIESPPLWIWTSKEACFKALSNAGHNNISFQNIVLKDSYFTWEKNGKNLQGKYFNFTYKNLIGSVAVFF